MGGQEDRGLFLKGTFFKILKKAAQQGRMKIVFKFFEREYVLAFE